MPFIAPLIAGAIGLGAVGSAVLQVGLAVGLSFAATKLRPKVKNAKAETQSGVRLGLRIDTNPPRQVIIGETATSGSLVYWQLSGTDNKILHMVFALADHECTSLQGVLVNNKLKSRDAGTGEIDGYDSNLIVRFYSGAAGQTADSDLVSTSGGRWTSNDVGTGVCYVVVKMTYDEKLFPEGIPDFGFVVRGSKLIDPRTGTSAYSDNPAVAIFSILRGITVGGEKLIGMNVPIDAIRDSDAEAAANACDELIAKKAGGTEKRYRCNVVLDCTQSNRDMIETLLASMAGEVIESGGIYRIMAGVAQVPVASLTDADLIVTEPLITRPKRSRNEIVNAIQGSFTDPSRGYAPVALPPRTSSTDEDSDGGIRMTRSLDLVAVTSRSQAQRILEIERRRARRMASASMKVRARRFGLEPGDWVTYSSDRRGYVEKTFVVQSKTGNRDLTSDIVLVETDAAIDDWTAATDEIDDDQVIDLSSAGPGLSSVSGIDLDAVTIEGATGQRRPGLLISWAAITDPTVISLALEYRKVGDSIALSRTIIDASAGEYAWADGIQGSVTYEARLRPITMPERTTAWSSWVTSSAESIPQVVAVAASANALPPEALTREMLDPFLAHELSLLTASEEQQGSVQAHFAELLEEIQRLGAAHLIHRLDTDKTRTGVRTEIVERIGLSESFASYRIEATAAIADKASAGSVLELSDRVTVTEGDIEAQGLLIAGVEAALPGKVDAAAFTTLEARVTSTEGVNTSQASAITSVATQSGTNNATISQILSSTGGGATKYVLAADVNGKMTAAFTLDGSASRSTIAFLASLFQFYDPTVSGGSPLPLLEVRTVGGQARMTLNGTLIAKAIEAGQVTVTDLSALTANIKLLTAWRIQNAANTMFTDYSTGDWQLG